MFLKIAKPLKTILPFLSGVVLLAALLHINNAPEYLTHVQPDPFFLVLTIGINILLYCVFAWRWQCFVLAADKHVSVTWAQCLFYYVTAGALGVFVPNTAAMLSVGAGALERFHGISLKKGAATILLEKACDTFPILCSIPPVLLLILNVVTVGQALWVLLLMLFVVSILFAVAVNKLKHISHPAVKRVMGSQIDIPDQMLLKVVGLTIIAQILQMVRVWLITKTVGIDISLPVAVLGLAGIQASSLLSITPGGLGFKEGASYLIFHAAGVLAQQISVYMLAYRSLTSLFLLFFWLPLYGLWLAVQKMKATADAPICPEAALA